MKHSVVLCVIALLASSSAAMAGFSYDQEKAERPRQVQISSGFLGVELGEVTGATVQRLKLKEERGALIEGVVSESSAAQAGLQKNDVITRWGGEPIESVRELSRHIRETPSGRAVRLTVMREGSEIQVNLKMGERPALANRVSIARPATVARVRVRPETRIIQRFSERGHLGVQIQSMTPQLAEYFGLSKRSGALVVFVYADSPAAKAGLKAGDVILSADGAAVENPGDIRRVLTAKPQGTIDLKVLRDKREQSLTVEPQKGTGSWLLEKHDFGEAELQVSVPRINIAPMAVELPRINVVPAAIAIPRINIAPMKIDLPKISISPVKVIVAPRRILL